MTALRAVLLALGACGALALPGRAQDVTPQKGVFADDNLASATGALLRGLDKIAGSSTDIPLSTGQTVTFGQLLVTLRECRYPADDPSSNAYAYLTIREKDDGKVDFDGWMIADSPALSALDHPRYDVWVIRCKSN